MTKLSSDCCHRVDLMVEEEQEQDCHLANSEDEGGEGHVLRLLAGRVISPYKIVT